MAGKKKMPGYADGGSVPTAGSPGPSKKQHNVPLKKGGGMKKVEPGYSMSSGNAQSSQGGFTGKS